MLRPLPPFRAKPARRALVIKAPTGKDTVGAVSIKAPRLAIRLKRAPTAPSLKVLGRPADGHA